MHHRKVYQDIDIGSGVTSALAPEHHISVALRQPVLRVTTTQSDTQRYTCGREGHTQPSEVAVFELFFSVFVDISHQSTQPFHCDFVK